MATRRKKSKKARTRKTIRYADAKKIAARRSSGFDFTSFSVPEGTSLWKPKKAGPQRLDIIPYVCGPGNPECEEGMVYYERTFWVHRIGQGKNTRSYVCPRETFNKKCPICEHNAKVQSDPNMDDDLVNWPKRRQLFNVVVHGEEDKGIQIWEYSFHQFGKILDSVINDQEEDEDYDTFFHLDGGKTLKLSIAENPPYGFEVSNIEFKPRKKLADSLLEDALCLDELVKETPYKKLKKLFLSAPVEDEEEDDDDLPEDDDEDEDDDVPFDEDDDEDEEEDDEWDDDEDEDEEPPKRRKKKSAKKAPKKSSKKKPAKKSSKKRKVEEEEDDEDDEEEDDEWLDDDDDDDEEEEEDDDEDWG